MTKEKMKYEVKKMAIALYRRMYENKAEMTEEIKTERFKAWSIANLTATKLGILIDYTEESK